MTSPAAAGIVIWAVPSTVAVVATGRPLTYTSMLATDPVVTVSLRFLVPAAVEVKASSRGCRWASRAPAAAQRDAHLHSLRQLLEFAVGPFGTQFLVRDDVRTAGAGVGLDAEHRPDLVVLEAGGEDVAGAVALRVGHQHDRALVELPYAVDHVNRVEREGGGVRRAGGHRFL